MKRAWWLVVILAGTAACTSVTPDPGTVAVLTRKPLFLGHGGVDPNPVLPGRSYVAWTTQVLYVDMRPWLVNVEFDDLMSKDGVPLDFNAAVRGQYTDAVKLVSGFGADSEFFKRNVEQFFRTTVRDAVKKRGMNEMAIEVTAAEAVDAEVTKALNEYIIAQQLPMKLLDVNLGRANPPDAIKHQRIDTATQEQRINTEKQRKLADDQRKLAEESRAAADNAYRLAMQLSPDQFLQLERIKMQRDVCAAGKCVFVVGNATPMVQVGQ